MKKILSIVIPVFNEKDTLNDVIQSIEQVDTDGLSKEIIVVDDFSTDGTRGMLKNIHNPNLKIFFNNKNSGKGFSVRFGLSKCTGDFILIQDADLEYHPSEYRKMLKPLISGGYDVVYGSRFLEGGFKLKPYYLANKFLTALSNVFTGLKLTDMETCYKCFSREALNKILPKLISNRFDIEPEITAVVSKCKLKITEVPISYNRRSYAEGKKIGWKDGVQAIMAIIKFNL